MKVMPFAIEVLAVSATHFKMPTCVIKVSWRHLQGEESKLINVRLGAKVDLEQLFKDRNFSIDLS